LLCIGLSYTNKVRLLILYQVLAQQELLFPKLYWSLKTALHPLMSVNETGMENLLFGKNGKPIEQNNGSDEDD